MAKIRNIGKFMVSSAKDTLVELIAMSIRFIPGFLGNTLRYSFYKRRLKFLGKNVLIDVGVYMLNPKYISIGDNTWIDKNAILIGGKPSKGERIFVKKENKSYRGEPGELKIGGCCHISPNCLVQAHGGVQIGDNSGLASGAEIYSMSNHYRNLNDPEDTTIYKFTPRAPQKEQCLVIGPVVMEDNTALGLKSIILPGVTIGRNSWVGVNSYAMDDIPPNSIAIGSPAKVIKKRFEQT